MNNKISPKKIELIKTLIESSLYHVDSDGSVWTKRAPHGHVLNSGHWRMINEKDKTGEEFIKFQSVKIPVSMIVYQKFIADLDMNTVISHRDGNKHNNSFKNLMVQPKRQTVQTQVSAKKLDLETKREIYLDHQLGLSQKKIMAKYGVNRSMIHSALKLKGTVV